MEIYTVATLPAAGVLNRVAIVTDFYGGPAQFWDNGQQWIQINGGHTTNVFVESNIGSPLTTATPQTQFKSALLRQDALQEFNLTNGTFTPKVGGFYNFWCSASLAYNNSTSGSPTAFATILPQAYFSKTGVQIGETFTFAKELFAIGTGSVATIAMVGNAQLAANDTLSVIAVATFTGGAPSIQVGSLLITRAAPIT